MFYFFVISIGNKEMKYLLTPFEDNALCESLGFCTPFTLKVKF